MRNTLKSGFTKITRTSNVPASAGQNGRGQNDGKPSRQHAQSAPENGTLTQDTHGTSDAGGIVERFHEADGKIAQARQRLLDDPDTLGDKAFKSIVPMLTGILGGKAFQWIWDNTLTKYSRNTRHGAEEESTHQQGIFASIIFAVLSAAFGAVISEFSNRSTQAVVNRIQRRRK